MLKKYGQIFLLLPVLVAVLFSCSPSRRLKEGESLLVKNKIVELDKPPGYSDKIYNYLQQKPNRKFLGFWRLYLQIYNLPNPEKMPAKKQKQVNRRIAKYEKYIDRVERKNQRRLAKNPDAIKKVPKDFKDKLTFGEWLQSIGEAPAILDTELVARSVEQLTIYARNKGFFQASVRDSIFIDKKGRATVTYFITRGPAYFVDTVFVVNEDSTNTKFSKGLQLVTAKKVYNKKGKQTAKTSSSKQTLLSNGMRYDLDVMKEERDRLETEFKNIGYYLFSKDYITYQADTGKGNQRINLYMTIKKPNLRIENGDSSLPYKHHLYFLLSEIYVDTDYGFQTRDSAYTDTVEFRNYKFLYRKAKNYKPLNIARRIRLEKGANYRPMWETLTQNNLGELKNFRLINILYTPQLIPGNDSTALLRCDIRLTPNKRQSFSVDGQGTNTDGNLGVAASFTYQNKNIFKGAEILEFRVNVGAEIQVIQGDSASLEKRDFPFNTFEFGAQLSLITPRFIFPGLGKIKKKSFKPFTRVSLSFNYQNRPDYQRVVGNFSFGYELQQSRFKKHFLNILDLSIITIEKSEAFEKYISETNDLFVINSFRPHFIENLSYTYRYDNFRAEMPYRPRIIFRMNLQPGGNLMALIALTNVFPLDNNNQYTVFNNVPYAQFIRAEGDLRFYGIINPSNTIALRAFLGIGLPYGNSNVLPFEKSFSAGGSNDIRAWRPRDLGPGSYIKPEEGRVDQVGDVKIMGSIEYRGKIYRFLEGAVFADFGNVWLIRSDTNRTNGEFKFDRFFKEIALGVGAGVRLNFNFFIFRLDLALPFHDPSRPEGSRWVVSTLKGSDLRFNIGIGYPF